MPPAWRPWSRPPSDSAARPSATPCASCWTPTTCAKPASTRARAPRCCRLPTSCAWRTDVRRGLPDPASLPDNHAMDDDMPYTIDIRVETRFVPQQSRPHDNRFVFAYTITLRNTGDVPAQLLSRHWVITDANGKVEEVRGDGVIGEQPWMRPGDDYQYTSG